MKTKHNILLTPGPVPLSASVRHALSQATIHHRSKKFSQKLLALQSDLKTIFQTKQTVLLLNATGTGAMASALLNTLSPKDEVLVLSAGKFGKRWQDLAVTYQLKTHTVKAPWGKAISTKDVSTALKKHPSIKAVLLQACETSTGVWHPVQKLAQLTRKKTNTLFILDAISAVGAIDIPMDKWGIDIMIGGSQKAFGVPAGMSFIALSKKAWNFYKTSTLPAFYFDLKKEQIAQLKGQTAFSSNVAYINALHVSCKKLAQNLKGHFQHTRQLSQITQVFCKALGLRLFAQTPSPSVTAIMLPSHIDGVKLKQQIEKKYGVVFAGGQGSLKGSIIRIGHLHPSTADLLKGLKALALVLRSVNYVSHKQVQSAMKIIKNML